jgi:hypothetical protein
MPAVTTIRRSFPIAAALAFAGVVAMIGSSASAQDPATRTVTFTELEKGATFTHVRHDKHASARSNLQGDVLVFTNRLADASGKRLGRQQAACVTTTGARDFRRSIVSCQIGVTLADGTLTVHIMLRPNASVATGAVTGGTGAYAGARGTVVSRNGTDTVTLLAP